MSNYPNYLLSNLEEEEAYARNLILNEKYNKIPSYAVWRMMDIANESIVTRINWWLNYNKSENKLIKLTSIKWLKLLNYKE